MIHITDKHQCSGCTACSHVCAHQAIHMVADSAGFRYPIVDMQSCTQCGLCDKVCQFSPDYHRSTTLPVPRAFAARHRDMSEIMKSRSGAVFSAISDLILQQGGVVYGAVFGPDFTVRHARATTAEQRDKMRGSKYVESDISGIFPQVKKDLHDGLPVLFTGTPCQVAGLSAYIPSNQKGNLWLVDIICSGVPSPRLWGEHIQWLSRLHDTPLQSINCRDKVSFGWKAMRETYVLIGDQQIHTTPYLFYQSMFFRPSCSQCPFTNTRRVGDLTLGDYWGWERTDPHFNADDKGCSLVICNTEKGLQLFNSATPKLTVLSAPLSDIIQNRLRTPTPEHPQRSAFLQYYQAHGYEHALRHFGFIGWRRKVANLKKRILRRLGISF